MATTADYKIPSKVFDVFDIKDKNAGTSTGKQWFDSHGDTIETFSPTDGETIAHVTCANKEDYEKVIQQAQEAFKEWRKWPAPSRGHVIRAVGSKLRERKDDLGALVSYEMGKSLQEGKGEVQEMIDICDFATGLSKQLYGHTMHSERPDHRLYEQYHPLGVVGLITAFNFPVAVWAWNTMIALTCGDTVVWKPSDKTPLCARACQKIMGEVFEEFDVPEGVSNVVTGDAGIGEQISHDDRIPLVSATGSIAMGKKVGQAVISRLGKPLLELGGNNGMIITPSADIDLTLNAALFGAVGTAGQRCTTTRRLIIHEDIYEAFKNKLVNAYKQLKIGHPLDENNHVGPLIDQDAVSMYFNAVSQIKQEGGHLPIQPEQLEGEGYESGLYVRPIIAEVDKDSAIAQEETFAPILYLIKYKDIEEAMDIHNGVRQGLSSAIMTNNLRESEYFLSHEGSDTGIANVNIGTSGAEIGGAFGGEKDTGGGRESGSDAWKVYMRRQTNTINYGTEMPLAQGIKFEI